jgi:hypothetical protein
MYKSLLEISLGDKVRVEGGDKGVVVFSASRDEYSNEYPTEDWYECGEGVMVKTENGALVFIDSIRSCGGTLLIWPDG